jgi:hypothetical protein
MVGKRVAEISFSSQKLHSLKLLIVPTINFIAAAIIKKWKKN